MNQRDDHLRAIRQREMELRMVPAGATSLRAIARSLVFLVSLLLAQTAAAANLSGIVYGDGTPLESARVSLYDQSSVFIQSQQTDASGAYQFDSLAAGTYFLNVDPPANSPYATTSLRQVDVTSSDVTVDFILISASFIFSGIARDQHGQPIDGLRVHLDGQSASGGSVGTLVITDTNGVLAGCDHTLIVTVHVGNHQRANTPSTR